MKERKKRIAREESGSDLDDEEDEEAEEEGEEDLEQDPVEAENGEVDNYNKYMIQNDEEKST